ncbi:MAG: hypothetical protein EA367_15475 [Leptolyngbya sp. DLM2.Bin15]|nr:MAG: hypothetical protein EA367_15475 [Leptolyngbya sp. DLM2.Bin15]
MSLPLLPPTNDTHFILSGDVTLHPGTAIAPGVVLQADPGCRIVIEAGVCIGMGSVLHAYQGTVHIEQGAILGLQVLVVGAGRVGQHACLGSGVTIFACDVAAGTVVPAGTLMGQMGRQAVAQVGAPSFVSSPVTALPQAVDQTLEQVVEQIVEHTVSETQFRAVTLTDRELSADPWEDESSVSNLGAAAPELSPEPSKTHASATNASENGATGGDRSDDDSQSSQLISQPTMQTPVYGQASLDRLMGMLFPHRQALQSDSDEPNKPDS